MPVIFAAAAYRAVAGPARIPAAVLMEPLLAPVTAAFVAAVQATLVAVAANLRRSAACAEDVPAVKFVAAGLVMLQVVMVLAMVR